MNRHSSYATYCYYGVDDRHDYGRDSGDDGVDDTTDSRNDGALRERHWFSARIYGISW